LRGKFFESLGPECGCGSEPGCRQWRGYGEMKSGMKSGRLICDSEIAIELFKLTAQSSEAARQGRGVADVVIGTQETIEGCFDECRFCGAGTLGRFCQPRSYAFGEINANSGFHGEISLDATQGHHPWCKRITVASVLYRKEEKRTFSGRSLSEGLW
jgi:hypothetical protein